MKNIFKYLSVVMALVLILTAFAACGGKDGGQGSGDTEKESSSENGETVGNGGSDGNQESDKDNENGGDQSDNGESDKNDGGDQSDNGENDKNDGGDQSDDVGDNNNNVGTDNGEDEKLYQRDGDYIYFGEYPQSLKAENVTVSALAVKNGYYLGSDGSYYAKVFASPYDLNGYKFSTGEAVRQNQEYYFKVEPIRWRIISEEDGSAIVLCDSIINHRAFNVVDLNQENNSYAESTIRAWLVDEFYNTAFDELQKELIMTVEVDNSVESTGFSQNPNAGENTNDKVFLLSYKEITNSEYGFGGMYAKDENRIMKPSDFAIAIGIYMSTSEKTYGDSFWWTRSPNKDNRSAEYCAYLVTSDGSLFDSGISVSSGIVPALKIKL